MLDRAPLVGVRLHHSVEFAKKLSSAGFMLHYLHVFPWTLNLTLALLISSVIFGFNAMVLRVLAEL